MGQIAARIAQINKQITALSPQRTSPTAPAATTTAGDSFAAHLDTALRSTGTAGAKLNQDGVPVDLVTYGNGRIPPNALQSIDHGSHRLWAPAAESFKAMTAAARRDGVTIGVTDSYRSYDQQVDLAKRKGLYSQGGLAAKPGTSEHGWGLSLDLDLGSKAQSWMRAHAKDYGFTENVPREPWHWTFKPSG
jgi:LAS superfamily LD-carboxypeptidase LdcB